MLASQQISPQGPEVQGKYSADLFVQRAQTIFKVMIMKIVLIMFHRATLEKIVEYTEHNIKVLSKVEPGLTLTYVSTTFRLLKKITRSHTLPDTFTYTHG